MEMHQVRYFLAVARVLNFTRAAEECNVAQPSLTRAIKQLEDELGGDLFRRERPHVILTDLGDRMLPLLKQCYDSALGARSLASSIKSGDTGSLKLALSRSIDLAPLIPHLTEIQAAFSQLELKFLRGGGLEVAEHLKKGEAELGIASVIGEVWDRLDQWPLFTEHFLLIASNKHRLANAASIDIAELRDERFLLRSYCEQAPEIAALLRSRDIDVDHAHEITSERDLMVLVEADIGVAIVPNSATTPDTLMRVLITGLDLTRTVYLYGVAGRQRTAVAATMMKMLRGADWSRLEV